MSLYYEAHVTIEPVFDERLKLLKEVCLKHGFRVADLLMRKRTVDRPERSRYDTFCTGRSNDYNDLEGRMRTLLASLREQGFKVWRYKVEDTLLDSKIDDTWYPLP